MADIKKVVLAYSGGLDSSTIVKWLQTELGAEVATFTADLGQGEEVEPARHKAITLGVKPEYAFVEDVREEELWNREGLGVLAERLLETYPGKHEVVVYEATTLPLTPPKILRIPLAKLAKAREMGATHTVDSSAVDPVAEIKRICAETYEGADGADVVVEAVGRPETWKQAFYARDLAGTVVLVGVPTPEMRVPDIPLIDVFGRGGALKSSWYGDCLPSRDFPMLVELFRQGRFPLDAFVSERIGIEGVEEAFTKMHDGDVLRSVVVMGGSA